MSRKITEPEKKIVAHRQAWKCSQCKQTLPPTYQVDHTIPLHKGGADSINNCTAMCPNCHAAKTQLEIIQMHQDRVVRSKEHLYDIREDIISGNKATCEKCGQVRDKHRPHLICIEIETPGARNIAIKNQLSQFMFVPRPT